MQIDLTELNQEERDKLNEGYKVVVDCGWQVIGVAFTKMEAAEITIDHVTDPDLHSVNELADDIIEADDHFMVGKPSAPILS